MRKSFNDMKPTSTCILSWVTHQDISNYISSRIVNRQIEPQFWSIILNTYNKGGGERRKRKRWNQIWNQLRSIACQRTRVTIDNIQWNFWFQTNNNTDTEHRLKHTFSEGMQHWPFGLATFVARRAISKFPEIPALAVHPVVSNISFLITDAKNWGSSTSESVTSINASSQLTACF